MPHRLPVSFCLPCALALLLVGGPAGAATIPLATYRAVHDLVLDKTAEGAAIDTAKGRLVTEFTGSACTAYTTVTRLVTEGLDSEGDKQVHDQRSTTVETPDGRFEFTNESYANDKLAEESRGVAQRNGSGSQVTVQLRAPTHHRFAVAGGVAFPTEQIARVIAAAEAGERFLAFDVYDGSGSGEEVLATATVIGAPSTATDDIGDETAIADAGLAAVRHWPVTISYFEKHAGTDESPFFVLTSILYENGIIRGVRMDYGSFALVGRLTRLDVLPSGPCPD